jgi:hypothetical protein
MACTARGLERDKMTGHLSRLLAMAWLWAGISACASGPESGLNQPGLTRRDSRIIHESCAVDAKDARRVDANGDGKADVTIVSEGGKEVCRAVDLNFDGIVDSWIYFDAPGNVRRRESDFDRDGRLDEIAVYKAGVVVERRRATTEAGKLDTWHFFEKGALTRTERDSNLDSVIDQWWEYPRAGHLECPLIHSDADGDGRPDLGSSVDVCGDGSGYVPPERPADTVPGAKFERSDTSSLPTEVEDKPATDQPEKPAESSPAGG